MNPQTLNPYVYCLNNPLKYIDPTGQRPLDWEEEDWWGKDYTKDTDEEESGRKKGRKSKGLQELLEWLEDVGILEWMGSQGIEFSEWAESWGFEVSGSLVYFFGIGGGKGWVMDENGNWIEYSLYQEGFGLSGGIDFTLFLSSLSAQEVSNSECKLYELGIPLNPPFDVQVSKNEQGDIVKINIGGGLGFTATYWAYAKTSLKGLLSRLWGDPHE